MTKALKNTPPSERLAAALEPYGERHLGTLARQADLSARQMGNAVLGRPLATSGFLRLCAALKIDPLPDLPWWPWVAPPNGDFDFVLLAMGLRITRGLHKHTERQAGEAMGASGATVNRLEQGDRLSIGSVLRACRYIGQHPFGYMKSPKIAPKADVSRENSMQSVG